MKLFIARFLMLFSLIVISKCTYTQPNTTIDLEKQKPEKYKEKLLKSEKTEDKNISALKRFFGNTVTHYNYYFNSNNKLEEVIEKAKENFIDDYSKLLPFYNYTLNKTSQDKNLDSVILKCNAGILLHDLRTNWVDDLYLLLGRAYMYRKNFDSAYYVFQYLNYIYAPKDDGFDVPIGSNASNTEGVFTVSTNEKKNPIINKLILRKPLERNETFIWIIRNYLEQGKTDQAASLISILKNDPYFPKRLHRNLNEMNAYCYYIKQEFDSAAFYLEKRLKNAENRFEKSRWEFLCGQMYQQSGLADESKKMYLKAIKHSSNPIVEVYAQLNMLELYSNKKSKNPTIDIDALNKLANKKRFINYRDLIYFVAGNISLQQNNKKIAGEYFYKSATESVDNPNQKSKSYLALADLKYSVKEYKLSYNFYDSVDLKIIDTIDAKRVVARKPALKIISKNIDAIYLQDSLQALAKLSAKELNEILKKIYKQYKKEKGITDAVNAFDFGSDNAPSDIYSTPKINTKPGEFYFDNEAVVSQGIKDFKTRWGNRPNVDSWNRAAAVTGKIETETKKSNDNKSNAEKEALKKREAQKAKDFIKSQDMSNMDPMGLGSPDAPADTKELTRASAIANIIDNNKEQEPEKELTPESLYNAIPLTEEKILESNKIIINALFQNGETFSDKLDDYPSAIEAYEELLRRFPNNIHKEKTLFNLAYCYRKTNQGEKELQSQEKLESEFGKSDLLKKLKDKSFNSEETEATQLYASIYKLFLEGDYENAKAAKLKADNIYNQKYWNPQLSFIEAVYYIKQRDDSTAINRLDLIVNGNADVQLKEKATLMISILKNRTQIEEHLSKLDSNGRFDSSQLISNAVTKDTLVNNFIEPFTIDKSLIGKEFKHNPKEPHYAVLLLDKVDDVFIRETKISFEKYHAEKPITQNFNTKPIKLSEQYTLILLGPLTNAEMGLYYIEATQPLTIKILPWLPIFKYTYSLIGVSNLEILKANVNMEKYTGFLKATFPGKF